MVWFLTFTVNKLALNDYKLNLVRLIIKYIHSVHLKTKINFNTVITVIIEKTVSWV